MSLSDPLECVCRWGCTDFYLPSPVDERSFREGLFLHMYSYNGTRLCDREIDGSGGSMRTSLETHAREPGVVLDCNPIRGAEAGRSLGFAGLPGWVKPQEDPVSSSKQTVKPQTR